MAEQQANKKLFTIEEESVMSATRQVEIFSAGCPVCDEAVSLVRSLACPSCEVRVLDMKTADVAARAKSLGIRAVPTVVVGGKPADCCQGRGADEASLRATGLGRSEI